VSNTIDGLFQLLLKNVWSQRNILHWYLTNTLPERQYICLSSKIAQFFWQIWSLDPSDPSNYINFVTRPNPTRGSTQPVSSSDYSKFRFQIPIPLPRIAAAMLLAGGSSRAMLASARLSCLLLETERQHGRVFWWSTKTRDGQRSFEQTSQVGVAGQCSGRRSLHWRQVSYSTAIY